MKKVKKPSPVEVSLNLMPAFYVKHTGIKYGEAYYFDPSYRAQVEQTENRFLYDVLGEYGVGSPEPAHSTSIFIQPIDLVMRTQNAQWRFPDDATLESMGTPWAGLTPNEIQKINPADAANHPVIHSIIKQYREMQKMYGDKADIFGIKSGMMNIHTPYTTAHHLCGEELFILMLTDSPAAQIIFDKIWNIYKAVFGVFQKATGVVITSLNMGDCSASMLSSELYREKVAPVNSRLAHLFTSVRYHSCGPSTALLEAFSEVASFRDIELGPGTDLSKAVRLMPQTNICPLLDPLVMMNEDPDSVVRMVHKVLTETAAAPKVLLCAWSFDRNTTFENLKALYQSVTIYNEQNT